MHEEKSKTSPSQIRGRETKAKRHQTNLREKKGLTQKDQKAQAMLPTGGKIKYNMSTSINNLKL